MSTPERGITPLIIDDLCYRWPLAFRNVLSTDTMQGSTNSSLTNIFPMVDILSLMSIDVLASLLSNVLLSVRKTGQPAIFQYLSVIWIIIHSKETMQRTLLESNLNHILTTKNISVLQLVDR
jgi:hypothetical protein